jgi:penicillin-binding protein 1A
MATARRTWPDPVPVRPRRKRARRLRRFVLSLFVLAAVALLAYAYVLRVYAPGLRREATTIPTEVQSQLASHGAPYVTVDQISPNLRSAIVAIEDRRFYLHPGIDPLGIVRATIVNLTNQRVDQGGSTLEEQLAKRAIVHDDRTLRGKLRTMGLAWAIDQEFSKRQILELYLNDAYYGRGAYGAAEAARVYFGTDAANLTVPEAAFLAALPQAPSIYGSQPRSAVVTQRWQTVLHDMEQMGSITAAQETAARRAGLAFAFPNP